MKLSSFILLLFLTTSLYANYEFIIEGTATGIIDGDSFNILVETELGGLSHRKINLCGIDAPELEQDHGYESWRYLSKLLNNKRVKVIYNISSLIGPISGRVYLDNDYINEILVRNGYAWYDIRLFPEFNKLAEAHEYAKSKKLALWQKRKPVPPWFWSKGQATIRSPYTLETPTKTINQVKKSTVKVFTRNGMGTGFFITNNGLILTNHHVTNEDKNVVIKLKNGNFKKVQQTILTNNSRKNDIVLLKVNGYYPDYLDLAPRSPIVGDYVFVIGHPKDKKEWNFSKGRIMGFGNMEYGNIQISAHVNFGSSGSAICNSKGQLIGQINSKLIKGKQILGLGLSLNGIKKFLKNTGNSKILKKRKTNIWMEDLAKNHISESINKYLNADKVEVVASYPLQNSQLIIAKRNYKSKKFLFVCNGFTADEIDEFKIGDKINISGVIKNYSFQKRTCKINIYQCSTKKYRELKNNNRKNKQVDNTNTWKGNINFLYYIFNCIIDYIKDIFYYIMSLF